jgi:hypothetical protein
MTIDLFDYEPSGFWDSADDCLCGGDAECDQPDCVTDRLADLVDERMDER